MRSTTLSWRLARIECIVAHEPEQAFGFSQVEQWQAKPAASNETRKVRTSNFLCTGDRGFNQPHGFVQVTIEQGQHCRLSNWLQDISTGRVAPPMDTSRLAQRLLEAIVLALCQLNDRAVTAGTLPRRRGLTRSRGRSVELLASATCSDQ